MSKFIRNKERVVSIDEFIKVVDQVNRCAQEIHFEKYVRQPIMLDAYFWETTTKFKLTWKLFKEKITYVCDKDGDNSISSSVSEIMKHFSRVSKVQDVSEIMGIEKDQTINSIDNKPVNYRENIGSASALLYMNPKMHGKAEYAYEYDLSNAYGQFLKRELPDITTCKYCTVVGQGQVGFDTLGTTKTGSRLKLVQPGHIAKYVFDLMPSPYKDYANELEDKIRTAKLINDSETATKYKNYFRLFVGQLQNRNPFWRAMIVEQCNNLVNSLRDENTLYCNTDSIISKVERPDIENNSNYIWATKRKHELFKVGNTQEFAYQWNDEIPTMRGCAKVYIERYNRTHEKPWNILTDNIPGNIAGSIYEAEIYKDQFNNDRIHIIKKI